MWKNLIEFVVDAGRWGIASELTGIVSFVVGIWEHSQNRPITSFALVCLSVPLFWIGAYRAWRKKKQQLESEKTKNQKPKFLGDVKEAFTCAPQLRHSNGVQCRSHDCIFAIRFSALNEHEMSPRTLENCILNVTVGGTSYVGRRASGIPDLGSVLLDGQELQFSEMALGNLTQSSQLFTVIFYIEGLKFEPNQKAQIDLKLVDSLRQSHQVPVKECDLNTDRMTCDDDLRKPFFV